MSDFKITHDDDIIKSDEGLIFNPYNSNNVEITLSQVQCIKRNMNPDDDNLSLYKRAFMLNHMLNDLIWQI